MPFSTDQILRCLVPLKLVIISEGTSSELNSIRTAIDRAFHGGQYTEDSGAAYFAVGDDLGVSIMASDFAQGADAAKKVLASARASALHTLVIALLHEVPTQEFGEWLDEIDSAAENDSHGEQGDLRLMPILLKDQAWQGDSEGLDYFTLEEYALRPSYAASHVLAMAWRMLGAEGEKLNLFISHAKLDGLPLAQSFRNQLGTLQGLLEYFYDAQHIPPGSSWRRILRAGVERSVVLVLRTNTYEERSWCVQEMDWAEDFGSPLVMVDARTQLVRAREFLPTGGSPCVHVPDGNLVRVLQSALREALRVRLFVRQITGLEAVGATARESTLRVPRSSLATLGLRCLDESKCRTVVKHVFVPEKFRESHRMVADQLVRAYFTDAWFGTPQRLVSELIAATP
jgi:hypothetical protein